MKQVFTSGQVAKICLVAPRTVSKWFDSGKLRGYRLPGSNDRRIRRDQLIRFLKENNMPLGALEEEETVAETVASGASHGPRAHGSDSILVVGAEPLFLDRLRELLDEDDCDVLVAHSGFEAGRQAQAFHPSTIIIDLGMGRTEALQIAAALRCDKAHKGTLIIALCSEDEAEMDRMPSYGFSDAFKKPFDVALLAERIQRSAVGGQRSEKHRPLTSDF